MEAIDFKGGLALHPLCTLFPRLTGAEFEALKADIVANGQREAITVHEGLVLDGGNRYRACIEAGVEPRLLEFTGADPVAFVLSANLHRRHLTPGQQAAIVASAQDWTRAHSAGGDRKSDQAATLPLDSVADRAAQSGASERTQRMADKVAKESPELAQKVAHGEISLPKALEQLAPRASAAKPAPVVAAPPPAVSPTDKRAAASAPVAAVAEPAAAEQSDGSTLSADPGDDDHFEQLIEENRQLEQDKVALQGEVQCLTERIALLTRDDVAAQVDVLAQKVAQFDSLATARFNEIAGLKETINGQRTFIDGLRRAAGLPKGGDLVAWVKSVAQRAA